MCLRDASTSSGFTRLPPTHEGGIHVLEAVADEIVPPEAVVLDERAVVGPGEVEQSNDDNRNSNNKRAKPIGWVRVAIRLTSH